MRPSKKEKSSKKENAATRKVIAGLGISLDGYIARLDGSVDFLFMPKDYSMGPFFKTIDTAILGRKNLRRRSKDGRQFYRLDKILRLFQNAPSRRAKPRHIHE